MSKDKTDHILKGLSFDHLDSNPKKEEKLDEKILYEDEGLESNKDKVVAGNDISIKKVERVISKKHEGQNEFDEFLHKVASICNIKKTSYNKELLTLAKEDKDLFRSSVYIPTLLKKELDLMMQETGENFIEFIVLSLTQRYLREKNPGFKFQFKDSFVNEDLQNFY